MISLSFIFLTGSRLKKLENLLKSGGKNQGTWCETIFLFLWSSIHKIKIKKLQCSDNLPILLECKISAALFSSLDVKQTKLNGRVKLLQIRRNLTGSVRAGLYPSGKNFKCSVKGGPQKILLAVDQPFAFLPKNNT